MPWTERQQQVIDTRNSSILVSAAAGSGKTAVLVERIMEQVLDKKNPKSIDEFLIVTFTNAAAGQMRDKIAAKLEEALEENPENEHLMRQLLLVNRADITTIDSFCLRLVKEHFSLLDMDSTFNIGDPGMMELLKNDVLDKMFDEKYKEHEAREEGMSFSELVDIFCGDKDDSRLKDEILKVYNMASSYPKPDEWLANAKKALAVETEDALNELSWLKKLIALIHGKTEDALLLARMGKELCDEAGGPDKNRIVSEEDESILLKILNSDSYEAMSEAMKISWPRLKICKGDMYQTELIDAYKKNRESYKKLIKEINIFKADAALVIEQFKVMKSYLIPLIKLVEEFSDIYMDLKQSRRLMEFADIEHMAYRLVCAGYDENGRAVPTDVGKEISKRYAEIFIDEYQDSNYLQEDILCSVSGIHRRVYNMFMVGDVKQSIYRFRMARPDLFISKYNRFSDSGDEIKIELANNFRSRDVVLNAVNYFFYQFMGADIGGINYDRQSALVPSKDFTMPLDEKIAARTSRDTEILVADYSFSEEIDNVDADEAKARQLEMEQVQQSDNDVVNDDEYGKLSKLALEANMIATRIGELTDKDKGMYVYDEDNDTYRPAEYRDIVILARSVKGFGETVYNELTARGIPVYLDDPKGYFNAVEIQLIMSLLSVVDNSRQDIPLAAVLLSPIGRLDENELAVICDYAAGNTYGLSCLYEKCQCYIIDRQDAIGDKLSRIMGIINELKADKIHLSISELIWKALDVTGYYIYASAMPMGDRRKANIDMLLEKADKFENGYYKGLFNFLRYIDKLKVNEIDFGEANMLGDDENVVRIISMHKSKGLEYPIVFASGLGRWFNTADSKENLIIHSDHYLASMVVDNKNRFKRKSFIRESFKLLLKNESMAEELRVLYVAMTRAKEKLILTGCETNAYKLIDKYNVLKNQDRVLLPYGIRQDSKSFMQLILAGMARYEELAKGLGAEGIITKKVCSYADIVSSITSSLVNTGVKLEELSVIAKQYGGSERYEEYKRYFEYEYPYQAYTGIRSKMSISDIKRMMAYDGVSYEYDEAFEKDRLLDEGMELSVCNEAYEWVNSDNIGTMSGSERGTLVHKFMELLPFDRLQTTDDYVPFIKEYLSQLFDRQIFDERELKAINYKKIDSMLSSGLGQRMISAAVRNELYREQQFSIGIPASQIYADLTEKTEAERGDDIVIVQGIIDAFFYEAGEIVLMDYKTDRADEKELIGRYHAQLEYYADTLEKLTGCCVKEKIIYSFYLNKEIIIDT